MITKQKDKIINLISGILILSLLAFIFQYWVFVVLNLTITSYLIGKFFIIFINKTFNINIYDKFLWMNI